VGRLRLGIALRVPRRTRPRRPATHTSSTPPDSSRHDRRRPHSTQRLVGATRTPQHRPPRRTTHINTNTQPPQLACWRRNAPSTTRRIRPRCSDIPIWCGPSCAARTPLRSARLSFTLERGRLRHVCSADRRRQTRLAENEGRTARGRKTSGSGSPWRVSSWSTAPTTIRWSPAGYSASIVHSIQADGVVERRSGWTRVPGYAAKAIDLAGGESARGVLVMGGEDVEQKRPLSWIFGQLVELFAGQKRISGGSRDTDVNRVRRHRHGSSGMVGGHDRNARRQMAENSAKNVWVYMRVDVAFPICRRALPGDC